MTLAYNIDETTVLSGADTTVTAGAMLQCNVHQINVRGAGTATIEVTIDDNALDQIDSLADDFRRYNLMRVTSFKITAVGDDITFTLAGTDI